LLLRGYERAALTLNFIRALCGGGFADLHHPENWALDFTGDNAQSEKYHRMVSSITDSLKFMEVVRGAEFRASGSVDVFTSHEGLHLNYEQAQTRRVPRRDGWYNMSTHFPWIGYRTRDVKGAHVEYFRGISNPIGIKVGPKFEPDELVALIQSLNPNDELGRITLIHRYGVNDVADRLPVILNAITDAKLRVLHTCDPMHGNTFSTNSGIKTRSFDKILEEVQQQFKIHRDHGTILGGVHLELTGDNVTECIGGQAKIGEPDLEKAYKSAVDPRLNHDQAMELAFLIADQLRVSQNKT